MKLQLVILSLLIITLLGCKNGEEGLKDQSFIQNREEIKAQNRNIEEWAEELLQDFKNRQEYIESITGTYEGMIENNVSLDLSMRITISSKLPYYLPDRKTPIDEVKENIQALSLNINIVQWNNKAAVASGCSFEDIIPDYSNGSLNLVSSDCDFSYAFNIKDTANTKNNYTIKSKKVEAIILNGYRESATFSAINNFSLKEVKEINDVLVGDYYVDENEYIKIKQTKEEYLYVYDYYTKTTGELLGEFEIDETLYRVRLNLSLNVPYDLQERFYTYDELVELIKKVSLNIQAVIWNPQVSYSAVGCIFEDKKINLQKESISLISTSCNNIFEFSVDDTLESKLIIRLVKSEKVYSTILKRLY